MHVPKTESHAFITMDSGASSHRFGSTKSMDLDVHTLTFVIPDQGIGWLVKELVFSVILSRTS